MINKLEKLIEKSACGVYVSVNQHKDYYESVEDNLNNLHYRPDIEPEIEKRMIDGDTMTHVQFYPNTPVGSISVYHYDLEKALNQALAYFDKQTKAQ